MAYLDKFVFIALQLYTVFSYHILTTHRLNSHISSLHKNVHVLNAVSIPVDSCPLCQLSALEHLHMLTKLLNFANDRGRLLTSSMKKDIMDAARKHAVEAANVLELHGYDVRNDQGETLQEIAAEEGTYLLTQSKHMHFTSSATETSIYYHNGAIEGSPSSSSQLYLYLDEMIQQQEHHLATCRDESKLHEWGPPEQRLRESFIYGEGVPKCRLRNLNIVQTCEVCKLEKANRHYSTKWKLFPDDSEPPEFSYLGCVSSSTVASEGEHDDIEYDPFFQHFTHTNTNTSESDGNMPHDDNEVSNVGNVEDYEMENVVEGENDDINEEFDEEND